MRGDWVICKEFRNVLTQQCKHPAIPGRTSYLAERNNRSECILYKAGSSVVDPECLSRIRIFPFRIPGQKDSGSRIRIKEFMYFKPKKLFLISRKNDPECSSRIKESKRHRTRIRIRNTGWKDLYCTVYILTINVPLFKKLRDIIFFCGTITF